jgi:PAP2 superfamily
MGVQGAAPLRAEEDKGENRFGWAYLDRFGRDFTEVIKAPSKWDQGDLLMFAAVSGTGLALMALDQEIKDNVQSRRTESSDSASAFFSVFGNGAALLGLSAAIYAAGEIGHNDGFRKTALLSVESLATASLLVWTIKVIAGRARPYTGESSGSYHPFTFESDYMSLPSGHAAAAFSVATTIALQTRGVLIDIAAYGLAAMAGLSRIHDNKHWASDVFIGSALGYFVGRKIVELNRPGKESQVSLGFQCFGGRQALTLNIAF